MQYCGLIIDNDLLENIKRSPYLILPNGLGVLSRNILSASCEAADLEVKGQGDGFRALVGAYSRETTSWIVFRPTPRGRHDRRLCA